jgi:hypothetical protein
LAIYTQIGISLTFDILHILTHYSIYGKFSIKSKEKVPGHDEYLFDLTLDKNAGCGELEQ